MQMATNQLRNKERSLSTSICLFSTSGSYQRRACTVDSPWILCFCRVCVCFHVSTRFVLLVNFRGLVRWINPSMVPCVHVLSFARYDHIPLKLFLNKTCKRFCAFDMNLFFDVFPTHNLFIVKIKKKNANRYELNLSTFRFTWSFANIIVFRWYGRRCQQNERSM